MVFTPKLSVLSAPAHKFVFFQFSIANNFVFFSKKRINSTKNKNKSDIFGTKYLKTHLHRVISKMVFPHPQLDIKF